MHARTLAFSLASFASSLALPLFTPLAHAQAPGEVPPQVIVAPVVTPVMLVPPPAAAPAPIAPPPAIVCGTPRDSVMANRWAIGFSVGSMGLAPEGAPDDNTQFAVGELALRFRATPRFELEFSVGGGRERVGDEEGDLEVGTAAIAARFRFRPEAAWNWFVMAGLGGAAVTRFDATDEEREAAMKPLGMLGIGIERRFRHFALQAEARAIGIGDEKRDEDMPRSDTVGDMKLVRTPIATEENSAGGSLTLGMSYYF
jgi:hypothetical protein